MVLLHACSDFYGNWLGEDDSLRSLILQNPSTLMEPEVSKSQSTLLDDFRVRLLSWEHYPYRAYKMELKCFKHIFVHEHVKNRYSRKSRVSVTL